jgi:glycine cleavage system H protein
MIRYSSDHEWVRVDGDIGTVGITPFARERLGDLVSIVLPKVGARFGRGDPACTVESVKAAADVSAPVGGEVVAVNAAVMADPGLVNAAPADDGWLFKIRIADPKDLDGLMDETAYQALEK